MADLDPPPKKRTKLCFIGTADDDPEGQGFFTRETTGDVNTGSSQNDDYVMYENPQTGEKFRLRETSDSVPPAPRRHKAHDQTPRKIIPKRIVPNFDSDDELIIKLKELSRSDDKIVEELAKEGSTKYTTRTVALRWKLLRRALEQCDEENMDDEMYDWQMGEDAKLQKSVKVALIKHQEKLQKLEEKKWEMVASHLVDLIGTKKYSAKACRERHEAILAGDALLPIEIDPDQEGRAIARQQRIDAAKIARAQQNADAEREMIEKKQAEEKKKRDKMAAQEKEKADKEEELARQKEQRQEEKRQADEVADAHKTRQKIIEDWEKAIWKTENTVYIELTGKPLDQRRITLNHFRDVRKAKMPKIVVSDDEKDSGDEMELDEESKIKAEAKKRTAQLKNPIPVGRANVTAETIASPRSIMTMAELEKLLGKRNMERRGPNETHPQVVARLHWTEHYIMMSDDLSVPLLVYGDKGKGSKIAKADRLAAFDAKNCEAGRRGVTSTDPDFVRRYATSPSGAPSEGGTVDGGLGVEVEEAIDQRFQEYADTLMGLED